MSAKREHLPLTTHEEEPAMTTFHVELDVSTTTPLLTEHLDELVDKLEHLGAALSIQDERLGIAMSVRSDDLVQAAARALDYLQGALPRPIEISSTERIEVATESYREEQLADPVIPPLVGYAEIAEIAGVSRQRARQFADLPDFPVPVVETAAGPLRVRAAVEAWAATRNPTPGRPRSGAGDVARDAHNSRGA